LLETDRRRTDLVEERRRRDPRRRTEHALERERRLLGRLDPRRLLDHAELRQVRAQALEIAAARDLLRELAHRDDRRSVAHVVPPGHESPRRVEHRPAPPGFGPECNEVHAARAPRLCGKHGRDLAVLGGAPRDPLQVLRQRHSIKRMDASTLFAPLGPGYDRWSAVLSFWQDPRWRRFLVECTDARPEDTVLDVATGTAAVALELVRRKDCFVVGIDQSAEMLAVGRRNVALAGATAKVRLEEGDARALPFDDGQFDALTFTYLLRYVDDPAATLRELARVVRPGGTIAGLEFAVPRGLWRPLWELWVRVGLPTAGRAIGDGWHEVGTFLGPSIKAHYTDWPVTRLLQAWRGAGIDDVRARRLSLGGGLVTWGRRA